MAWIMIIGEFYLAGFCLMCVCLYWYVYPQALYLLPHSFPTRRAADLFASAFRMQVGQRARQRAGRRGAITDPAVDQHRQAGGRSDTVGKEIGRAHVELQSLMRISYAVFCLKNKQIIQVFAVSY